MILSGHQLPGTFANALRHTGAHKRAVVQEELQQTKVLAAELATQREIVTQPGIQVPHDQSTPRCLGHGLQYRFKDSVALVPHLSTQAAPTFPIGWRSFRLTL